MKNKILKGLTAFNLFILTGGVQAFGLSVPDGEGQTEVQTIADMIVKFSKPIAALLIFGSVLIIGFEIIMKRNKADERTESMTSLMWVGIGGIIIALAITVANVIINATLKG